MAQRLHHREAGGIADVRRPVPSSRGRGVRDGCAGARAKGANLLRARAADLSFRRRYQGQTPSDSLPSKMGPKGSGLHRAFRRGALSSNADSSMEPCTRGRVLWTRPGNSRIFSPSLPWIHSVAGQEGAVFQAAIHAQDRQEQPRRGRSRRRLQHRLFERRQSPPGQPLEYLARGSCADPSCRPARGPPPRAPRDRSGRRQEDGVEQYLAVGVLEATRRGAGRASRPRGPWSPRAEAALAADAGCLSRSAFDQTIPPREWS